jgi:hypothetical protein
MAESFVEKRKRELGLTSSAKSNESDFVTRRKMDLGLIPDTRPQNQAPTQEEIQRFARSI